MPLNALRMARLRKHTQHGYWTRPTFNPPSGLWIAGVNYTSYLIADSPDIRNTGYPQSGVLTFRLEGAVGGAVANVQVEQEVTFNIGGATYAGRVRVATPDDLRPSLLGVDVECQDFTSLLQDSICTSSRAAAETDAQRISWLLQSFDRRGISAYQVQALHSGMPPQDFAGMTLFDAIKAVVAYGNGSFYVDFAKDLHTFVTESIPAPFALSDSPDGVTSFGYAAFVYPSDSIDLRNAVYGIPADTSSTTAPAATETINGTGTTNYSYITALLVSLKPKGVSPIALVSAGPVRQVIASAISPTFSQPTQVGSSCLAAVVGGLGDHACTSPGWQLLATYLGQSNTRISVWIKSVCEVNEAAPAFTSTDSFQAAQVLEFSGILDVSPLEQFAGNSAATTLLEDTSMTVTLLKADAALGNLQLLVTGWQPGAPGTATFSETFNLGTAIHTGDTGQGPGSSAKVSFSYTVTTPGAVPTWYTDEASIAARGRREASFTDTNVVSQAALDALGAAYLSAHAAPARQASLACDQPGLMAGQTVQVTNALHGLSAQSFRIQSIETKFSDNVPRFGVEFIDPTADLATQLGDLQERIAAGSATNITPQDAGQQLGYAEITANQTGITAEVDVGGLNTTVSVVAGRRIRISAFAQMSSTVLDDTVRLTLKEGATQLQFDQQTARPVTTTPGLTPSVVLAPSAGSHTYKVTALRTGTGSATVQAGATFPAYILVEDLGT